MQRREFLKLIAAGAAVYGLGGVKTIFAEDERQPFLNGKPRFIINDAHFHYVNFLQQTDGIHKLIRNMDQNGVEHIMFSGMPLVKKWDKDEPVAPGYYLDDNGRAYWYSATDFIIARTVMKLPEELRWRFHPFTCGFNCTDKFAINHVKLMMQQYPGLWHGVGEILAHRDDLTNLTYGETAHADHVALDPIYDLAGKEDLPVNLHNNCTSRAKLKELLYVHEVENALRKHPQTRIVWAHAGLSRYLDVDLNQYTQMLGKMLADHPNMYIDLSWIVFENYVLEDRKSLEVRKNWLDLINSYPDRFMLGSDAVGRLATYPFNIRKYYTLLEKLSGDTVRKVARDNFLAILPAKVRKLLHKKKDVRTVSETQPVAN